MQYSSTRNNGIKIHSSQAILEGIAADGGLFVDDNLERLKIDMNLLQRMNYLDMASYISKTLLRDFSEAQIRDCVHDAYLDTFYRKEIAPLAPLENNYVLELFHGPTASFKDIALSFLPKCMVTAMDIQRCDRDVVVLTATSGDTGKAAMVGFKDIKRTKIVVFYPEDGVSIIQKHQMISQTGKNIVVCGIHGDFDDAQKGVKELLQLSGSNTYQLSSANSINIGRLIPQIVYYFYSYLSLVNKGEISLGEEINVSVPTGNFGNILAGYYAKMLGLPIHTFICASNQNNVLFDFLTTGHYNRNRCLHKSVSPSMDILVSSNLERLLYYVSGKDCDYIQSIMTSLQTTGSYEITREIHEKLNEQFFASYSTDKQTKATIKAVYERTKYVMDPHTAVAYRAMEDYKNKTGDTRRTIVLATASPYKFPSTVYEAIFGKHDFTDDFEAMIQLARNTDTCIPHHLANLHKQPAVHLQVIDPEDISSFFHHTMINGEVV